MALRRRLVFPQDLTETSLQPDMVRSYYSGPPEPVAELMSPGRVRHPSNIKKKRKKARI